MISLTFDQWKERVAGNVALDLPEIEPMQYAGPPLCVCATGPSLRRYMGNLKRLHRSGAQVMALNRAYPFLISQGIVPDYVVVMDPGDMLEAVTPAHPHPLHLLASQVHPEVFNYLRDCKVAIWHAHNAGWEKWPEHPAGRIMVEGATVGINSLYLAAMLGRFDCHLFGFDGYHRGGKRHFRNQAGDANFHGAKIEYAGKSYVTDYHLQWQAAQLGQLKRRHGNKFNLTFHGRGLLSEIWQKEAA